jgi:poly-gamma-glutamate capsule biosynthesis protein CapA/YwtB (metallophosphatase superfamily)
MDRLHVSLVLLVASLAAAAPIAAGPGREGAAPDAGGMRLRGVVIEDFESGTPTLQSYPDQDQEPDAWELTSTNTYGGTGHALRIYGNSWKVQPISATAVADSTVWQVAAYVEALGEMQGFGVSDGVNELLYTFAGSQLPQDEKWWTVYQGAFPRQQWHAYLLPIGADWVATYGYEPTVTALIYVNDDDGAGTGITVFDEILDVSADLPVAPTVSIEYTVPRTRRVAQNLYRATVQFIAQVFDPDSESHEFLWDFGDGTTSTERNPTHDFLVESHYTYAVSVVVKDPDDLLGHDVCQVTVEVGQGDLPVTINFVGDIMTARAYEQPGGIIATYGIEALFAPTLPIFGEAADVNVANLECSYTDRGSPHPTKSVVFRARPENIGGIEYAGVDLVTLGNNHIVDYGEEGMLQTQELLDSLGVRWSGAGVNSYFALQPTFWTERGVRVAFLGQCNRTGRQWNYQPFLDAGASKAGFAYLLPQNLETSLSDAQAVADIVVLQTHSGDEYETEPPPGLARAVVGEAAMGSSPPPVEAAEVGSGDPDFRFLVEPTPGDRALRRLAIDLGADIVINHHPHVLQGFEVYDGKLIAHSLGNFVFDLYYPETMPTIVLTLEVGKDGIVGTTFVPAWIDDYIPQPATGSLGREILDRMADYSRPMGALVAVDPAHSRARIHLSRDAVDSSVTTSEATVALADADGFRISPPIELAGNGNLSSVTSVSGAGLTNWEVSWGREILWHGGFEAEGATFWDVNTADEWLDETQAHRGARSLALRRQAGDPEPVGTDLEKHLVSDPERRHSVAGWMKADNARDAVLMARFYSSRYSTSPISSADIGSRFTGTQDWFEQWGDIDTPGSGDYFELRCSNDAPATGTGHAWFDDLKFIEWEPWVPGDGPLEVPSPNNYRFLQIRSSDPTATIATVHYAETAYDCEATLVGSPVVVSGARRISLRSFPNPFTSRTRIELAVPVSWSQPSAAVAVYDVCGRKVATLFEGKIQDGSLQVFTWDGIADGGRRTASGVYFLRAQVGEHVECRKMVIVR